MQREIAEAAGRPVTASWGRRKFRAASRLLQVTTSTKPIVAYAGYAGYGNLGDEAILESYRLVFPGCDFFCVPRESERILRIANVLRRSPPISAVMLGGGTLVGRLRWRNRLERLFSTLPPRPTFMLGVGVEDPEFESADQLTSQAELEKWIPILARFDGVTVRGPRSKEILEGLGVRCDVVGDPALLLGDARPQGPDPLPILGINVGSVEPTWGRDPFHVLEIVAEYARYMNDRGWRITLLPFSPGDLSTTERLASLISRAVTIHPNLSDLASVLDVLRRCRIFVGQRLHSVVLASAMFVPYIALEYRPKVLDFTRSVKREAFTIRTDRMTVDQMVEFSEDLERNHESHRHDLFRQVGFLRRSLKEHASSIRNQLGSLPALPAD